VSKEKYKFTIGRARDCDIVLADETVSRQHAEVHIMDDGKLFIIDCSSTYGTIIVSPNGHTKKIRQELISPTDNLKFGDIQMSVKEMLEAIQLRFPNLNHQESFSTEKESRVHGKELVRCNNCGSVKKRGGKCEACEK
jgi:pSer/pThr/pTyr-binding forkhead associated (FHA) protein